MHQDATESGRLESIQVAQPQTIEHQDGEWTTAFYKQPVGGLQRVEQTGVVGDGQADLKHHGGIDKAVLAYCVDHYPLWNDELELGCSFGGFGENLSISGLDETRICIGDQWRIADITLEVSQPRQPCWKLGRRWSNKLLPKIVILNGRTGWYFRVLQPGTCTAGDELNLLSRPSPEWTVSRANEVFYRGTQEDKRALSEVALLSESWKSSLT